ncbi:GntR family transcriptional regulator [Pontivivens ytuae]|uniref:GntR family transcriptional regulator n=1 Tax=Pontivivens ytuae TaxID=2789856 RepID=A0A7S9LQB9_9RHOB|nr:GntR family transcriptional regulator [Pontivivens ytuae]QPH53356.1 GntR family transcriptional regulator [Pontivivens ytuae]
MNDKPRKLTANEAFEKIRDKILTGRIKPGDRLNEGELASELGLSRTPVREAIRRLESDGLVVHEPHRGVTVNQLDNQAVSELYTIREVLEATAAALAAQHASEMEIAALSDLLARQKPNDANPAEASRLNRIFHRAICDGAHNRYLNRTLDGLAQSMALLGRTTLSVPGRQAEAIEEHTAILDAIARRDAAAAEAAARKHIRSAHKARLTILYYDAG